MRLIFTEDPDILYIATVPAEFDPKQEVTKLENDGIFSIVRKRRRFAMNRHYRFAAAAAALLLGIIRQAAP